MQLTCAQCEKQFTRNFIKNKKHFCSQQCWNEYRFIKRIECVCLQCTKSFVKKPHEITKNNFCSSSCSCTYHNTHKTKGFRRSKLEIYIQDELTKLYTSLEILYNNKEAINSELDIYIPSLKLAFELNGIFHYEPIYGPEKLQNIKNNDNRKFQACLENKIELCIIDTSGQKYFKKESSIKYLNIIKDMINLKYQQSDLN